MDPVKVTFDRIRQAQRQEVCPFHLREVLMAFAREYVEVRLRRLGPNHEGQCGLTIDGTTVIVIRPCKETAGSMARNASVIMHEMVHAIKHYNVGNTVASSYHPGVQYETGFTWMEQVCMEMEAELNTYAVMSAFTSHPYVRKRSMQYTRNWNRFFDADELLRFHHPDLVAFLTEEVEKRL